MSVLTQNKNWLSEVATSVVSDDERREDRMTLVYETITISDYLRLKSNELSNLNDLDLLTGKNVVLVADNDPATQDLVYALKNEDNYKAYRISDNVKSGEQILLALSIILNKNDQKLILKTDKIKEVEYLAIEVIGACEHIVKGVIEATHTKTYASKEHEDKMNKSKGYIAALKDAEEKANNQKEVTKDEPSAWTKQYSKSPDRFKQDWAVASNSKTVQRAQTDESESYESDDVDDDI